MGFSNPITGGQGALVRPAIKSPNYAAGTSGWSINKDGSAEFANILIRGGSGDTVIVGPSTGPQVIIATTSGSGRIRFPTNDDDTNTSAFFSSSVQADETAAEYHSLQLNGPSIVTRTDRIQVQLNSQDTATSNANVGVYVQPAGTLLMAVDKDSVALVVRESIQPPASSFSCLFINAASGHTGALVRLQTNGTDQFRVDTGGVLDWQADTNLYRNAANELKTDDDLTVVGNLNAANYPSTGWTAFTPTWTTSTGASTPSFGNATLNCDWVQLGRTIIARYEMVFGSTTNFGGGGTGDNWRFSLPVAASATHQINGWFELNASTSARCVARSRFTTTSVTELEISSGRPDGVAITNLGLIDALSPWTWASGNAIRGQIEYEAA